MISLLNRFGLALAVSLSCFALPVAAVVPGTGILVEQVGDDFEAEGWSYAPNHPKSSRNIDKKERSPLGQSRNGRWLEGPHRGTPDLLRQVATPEGGLYGSNHSLLIRSIRRESQANGLANPNKTT